MANQLKQQHNLGSHKFQYHAPNQGRVRRPYFRWVSVLLVGQLWATCISHAYTIDLICWMFGMCGIYTFVFGTVRKGRTRWCYVRLWFMQLFRQRLLVASKYSGMYSATKLAIWLNMHMMYAEITARFVICSQIINKTQTKCMLVWHSNKMYYSNEFTNHVNKI